jgi:Spy/CpxP family protein refolding chaperone
MKNIRVLAVIAILIGAATLATTEYTIVISALAQATDNATMGGNMTGGNMTMGGGNMTDGNMTEATGQISGGGGRCGGTCYADSD